MTRAIDSTAPQPPRQAATLVLVRAGPAGPEVLLLLRAERGDHNSSAWVFPGGLNDPRDRDADSHVDGLDDAAASERLGLPSRGLDYYLTATRECFEESGLLLTRDPLPPAQTITLWRGALQRGESGVADFCAATGVRIALGGLRYLSHWVTPVGRPKRFDTRFFVALAPPDQHVVHDGNETIDHLWIRPADALARGDALRLLTPTLHTLRLLSRHATVDELWAWAELPRVVVQTMPCLGRTRHGLQPVTPDEPAYAELIRLDPERRGTAWSELVPGQPVRLSERLIRVTADNGSMMTGPGTNTYLVGTPAGAAEEAWAVIDPGPADPTHVEAVLAAAPGPIRWIFATHTHRDHSPATAMLQQHTGATVHGRVADHPQGQDAEFVPDVVLHGGERFVLGAGAATTTLAVIHTPGHASNHLCYLLEEDRLLLTGDHVMQSSTVVINPPDGDMAAYLHSMRQLLAEPRIDWIGPGHGFLMDQPRKAMQSIIDHRLRREQKVVDAVTELGPAEAEDLLPRVYADVPPQRHAIALRSLTAHLLKLEQDGRCRRVGRGWELAGAAG